MLKFYNQYKEMEPPTDYVEDCIREARKLGQIIRYVSKKRAKKLEKRGVLVLFDYNVYSYIWFMRKPQKSNIITAEFFLKHVGRKPIDDDLERCNCVKAGQGGHSSCGWNYSKNLPMFMSSKR